MVGCLWRSGQQFSLKSRACHFSGKVRSDTLWFAQVRYGLPPESSPRGDLFYWSQPGCGPGFARVQQIRRREYLLYTYGCPRGGNQEFCDRVLADPEEVFRFVNLNDSVAHVPLESAIYRHAPQNCFRFDEDGNLAEDDGSFRGDVALWPPCLRDFPSTLVSIWRESQPRPDWSTIPQPVIASASGTAYENRQDFGESEVRRLISP